MENGSEPRTLLVVDDSLVDRLMLKKIFHGQFRVFEAENGKEALDILHKIKNIDMVITDIQMPVIDGYELLNEIYADQQLCNIPSIVITASDDSQAQLRALRSGALDILTKPYMPDIVLHRVRNILEVISRREAANIEERHKLEVQMLRQQKYDTLTGLYNREGFYHYARLCLNTHPDMRYTLIRIDLDRFKTFNDTFGTKAGDKLLTDIGELLVRFQTDGILLGRLEADHFVGLIPENAFDFEAHMKMISTWLSEYPTNFHLNASIGIYEIVDPELDISLMCDRALMALRLVKNNYNNKIAYYDDDLRQRLLDEQSLTGEMNSALTQGQFLVYFQPQINYSNGTLIGAEALVRWDHPERGLLSPGEFIPLFEKNGFITKLDEYVWEQSCSYMRKWLNDEGKLLPISVSVNISRIDVYDSTLCSRLKALIDKYELPPAALRLEITENVYMEDSEQLICVVKEMKKLGFSVEMDDFGSGYSSLNMLKDVPVDLVKIDMRFLSSSEDEAKSGSILTSTVRLAHNINMPVIVEGVETMAQAEYLKSIGCLYMQGYYFSKPVPLAEFEQILKSRELDFEKSNRFSTGLDGAADFLDATTQATLLFNSFVGGAGIIEYENGSIAALRLNDKFFETLGITREEYPYTSFDLNQFTADTRKAFIEMLEKAIATGEETSCESCICPPGQNSDLIWTLNRVKCLAKKVESYIFYLSIENISERINLIEHNAHQQQELEALIANTPGGILRFRVLNGIIQEEYVSEGLCELLGYSIEELTRLTLVNLNCLIHPDDVQRVADARRRSIDLGVPFHQQYRLQHIDGNYIWVSLMGKYIGESNGSGLFYGSYTDITETKKLENDLANATDLYQRILNEAEDVIIVVDRATHEILFSNEAAMKAAELSPEQTVGITCMDFFGSTSDICKNCVASKLSDKVLSRELDFKGRHYHSRIAHIDWNGRDAFIDYLVDRTESFRERAQLNAVIRNIPGGLAEFRVENDNLYRIYLSDGAKTILGYAEDEVAPTEHAIANSRIHKADLPKMRQAMEKALSLHHAINVDFRIYTGDNGIRWINLTANPVEMDDGFLYFYGIYTNVTERKRATSWLGINGNKTHLHAQLNTLDSEIAITQDEVVLLFYELKHIFDVVRLVDAVLTEQYSMDTNGSLVKEKPHCYSSWHRSNRCENCISLNALKNRSKTCKFEFVDNDIYYVISKYVEVDGNPYVLELVSKIPDGTFFDAYGKNNFVEAIMGFNKKLYIDPVTETYNRRYFEDQNYILSKIDAIAMLDLDDFKQINDTYGHIFGDVVLHSVAEILHSHASDSDEVIRYGGDEYLILFHRISKNDFRKALDTIRAAVREITFEQHPDLFVTLSIGGFYCRNCPEDSIAQADQLLYRAKVNKNTVEIKIYGE